VPSGITATVSSQVGDAGPQRVFDNDNTTHWAPDPNDLQPWLLADYGRPVTVHRLRMYTPDGPQVKRFVFEYLDGTEWKTLCRGTSIGRFYSESFEPVTAQQFRLTLLETTGEPIISDIELFER